MHLYFLRHGKAENPAPGKRDFDRPLTHAGIESMKQEARGMHSLGLHWDIVFTSPLPRAWETARIVADHFQLSDTVFHVEEQLAAGNLSLGTLQSLLENLPSNARVLLVGHEPDLSQTISVLIGGGQVEMKRGGFAYLEATRTEPGGAVLRWLLTPKILEGLN